MGINPFAWIKGEVVGVFDHLVPSDMKAELGMMSHAFVANIKYDMKQMGLEAEHLTQEAVGQIWTAAKQTVKDVISNPAFATAAFSGNVDVAAAILVSDAAKNMIPALRNIGPTTAHSMATSAENLLKTGIVDAAQGQLQGVVADHAAAVKK